MVGKIDLVMWAKNGERVLPQVLKRIDEVIPAENICHKILVDDHSVDRTVEIARSFNWTVYPNPGGGIPNGANEALRHVDQEFFVSVEQDVLLARDWWEKIPPYMDDPQVAVAQGIRIATEPTLRKLDLYIYGRISESAVDPIRFGASIDNNIYRTKIIRELGGFPKNCPTCSDTILMKKIIWETPYKWIIDKNVISDHIRESIKAHVEHTYYFRKLCIRSPYCINQPPPIVMLRLFITSPLRAMIVALKMRSVKILYVYPLLRYKMLKASLH
ncbi:MAG: glycosyltransferase [Nitrososphaerota archaeon]|nr:glycosyltransferase [Nitrososphaerota archaeon]MDW8049367.1 glycosyltransferase [Nitrososphaerota archaeon]